MSYIVYLLVKGQILFKICLDTETTTGQNEDKGKGKECHIFLRKCRRGAYLPSFDQLSLLPLAGQKMGTGQSAMMLCGWGVKVRWLIPFVDKRVGGR